MSDGADPGSRLRPADIVGALQAGNERERARLAQLLHDELGGLLAAARMTLSRLSGAGPDEATRAELGQQLAQAFDLQRRAVERLRPGLLDHFGIGLTLSALYEQACGAAGIRLVTRVASELPAMPPERAIALYRIGEAALPRLLAAQPRVIELTLDGAGPACVLELRHDGADEGFGTAPELAGLALWLTHLQGRLAIRPAAPSGPALRATLPVAAPSGK